MQSEWWVWLPLILGPFVIGAVIAFLLVKFVPVFKEKLGAKKLRKSLKTLKLKLIRLERMLNLTANKL
jgi:hypothetical protein